MRVAETFDEAQAGSEGKVGLVPTMGALHPGHRSLMDLARTRCDTLVTSIFVNPIQFNDPADLDRYPRTLDADLDMCRSAGVDVVFAPSLDVMYPRPLLTDVRVRQVADTMEGLRRPGHFDGVATVVAKLFAGLKPDMAFFGRKDAQQLAVISTMTTDLGFPVDIVPCPTLRTSEGLAMSSRNVLLSDAERESALALNRGLMAAADAVEGGERDGVAIVAIARSVMGSIDCDYVELAGQERAEHLPFLDRPAFLAVAARFGATRLIDNVAFDMVDGAFRADRGVLLGNGAD